MAQGVIIQPSTINRPSNASSLIHLLAQPSLTLYTTSINIPNNKPKMSGWEVRFSNSKQLPYFYNPATSQSVWEKPEGLTEAQISQLPGAQYLSGGKSTAGGSGAGVGSGQVRASHILAKHAGSRRPSSWRQVSPNPPFLKPSITSMWLRLTGFVG